MEKDNKQGSYLPAVIIAALLISASILLSCRQGSIYNESEKIPAYSWNAGNTISFSAPVSDTLNAYNISLVIRTTNSYPYRNLFLFVETKSPEGYRIKDTVEYFLADEKGNWYGSGLGDINDLSVPFKTNVLFPDTGNYVFNIRHGMREKDLKGVSDIGIQIIKRKQ
ncbi:MAG: gliding motility lipoprotein GldH [Bacteroidales bacterium]|jgi:gliding motility-associated lipoprotein GldH|nr:gliding motility lipoprotein GldH [Bacteroidales bacterium]